MKGFLWIIVLMWSVHIIYAHSFVDGVKNQQINLDWFNCSFEEDGVYGVEANRAYTFLKDNKVKKKPIVALIGCGIDVEHEDLKNSIWKNKKERNNGKDNDGNGLIGDVYGWNYLGGQQGEFVARTSYEGDREFLRLKETCSEYLFDGSIYYKLINGIKMQVSPPLDLDEYNYYRQKILPVSKLAKVYEELQFIHVLLAYTHKVDRMLKERFPGKKLYSEDFLENIDARDIQDSLEKRSDDFLRFWCTLAKTSWQEIYDFVVNGEMQALKEKDYEKLLLESIDKRKEIVGDNVEDIEDNRYGNNVLLTSDAAIGTFQAGIVAAKRDNGLGINGIADIARIMMLRVHGIGGDPYLKDIVLAIRYAVDHDADIIVLPEQNSLYPPVQKQWMMDVLSYAEDKGVLVIVPIGESSLDLSQHVFYPNRHMGDGKELNNLMIVGSSDKMGNPSMNSNYGVNVVDLYAPGIEIYSTFTGDIYQVGSGSILAAATTAGVAALVKAYYPQLNGTQIRDLLIANVTSRKDVKVEKRIVVDGEQMKELLSFKELCLSGGILNAYQSIVAADRVNEK